MFLFPNTTSALNCFKPGGLFINTGFVYKHCVSVYRAFSVLSLLDLLVVFYVYYMIVNSCLLVLYMLLVVCLFVFIYVVMSILIQILVDMEAMQDHAKAWTTTVRKALSFPERGFSGSGPIKPDVRIQKSY